MIFLMEDHHNSTLVNAYELAEILRVRAATVRRWAREGSIPKLVLPGGRFVFEPTAVMDALRSSEPEESREIGK